MAKNITNERIIDGKWLLSKVLRKVQPAVMNPTSPQTQAMWLQRENEAGNNQIAIPMNRLAIGHTQNQ